MIIKCKKCGYEREKLKNGYEDYKCPICFSTMNEKKELFFNNFENETVGMAEQLENQKINTMINDIKQFGKEYVWNIIETYYPDPKIRLEYRNRYKKALKSMGL